MRWWKSFYRICAALALKKLVRGERRLSATFSCKNVKEQKGPFLRQDRFFDCRLLAGVNPRSTPRSASRIVFCEQDGADRAQEFAVVATSDFDLDYAAYFDQDFEMAQRKETPEPTPPPPERGH